MSLRLVFMGTPDFAVPTLTALTEAGHEIVAVYTRAPKRAGRGMAETRTPVHTKADALGLPVFTPTSLKNEEAAEQFAAHKADAAIVVAYGLLLPKPILDAPRLGCFNLHASLLPRWRGAAPINRAVMSGDAETGAAVMKMEEGLDTGPIALVEKIKIAANETAGELHDRLSVLGAPLMVRALDDLERRELSFTPQPDEGVLYAAKLTNAETRIEWAGGSEAVHNHIRGLSPFPGAWTEADFGKGPERLKILRTEQTDGTGSPGAFLDIEGHVACGSGAVRLVTVQRAGKGPMAFADFARGVRIEKGTQLS